jgi:hypothetical protein
MRSDNYLSNSLFQPSVIRSAYGNGKKSNVSIGGNDRTFDPQDSLADPNNGNLPFFYDQQGTPLQSTQQLNVDFSKFENHTFFNSARIKTQIAIQKVINKFPFDGTRAEYESFVSKLSGFEKHVLDSFPKSLNYLIFDSNFEQSIVVSDTKGVKQSSSSQSEKEFGRPALDMAVSPFTIEFHCFLPDQDNDRMTVVQRLESTNQSNGFTIGFEPSNDDEAEIVFLVSSGSLDLHLSFPLRKGIFHHLTFVYDRNGDADLKFYLDGALKAKSNRAAVMGEFNFFDSDLEIASGVEHETSNHQFQPQSTFDGALDEFRLFNSARSPKLINKHKNRNIFAQDDLKLYFKFNEPAWFNASPSVEDLVLDSSGNALHSRIQSNDGFKKEMRLGLPNVKTPLTAENPELSPILFVDYDTVRSLVESLLEEAEEYDVNNPNLITKLVPSHYLTESAYEEGLNPDDDYLSDYPANASGLPGNLKGTQDHVMALLLYSWAESFDDIKIFIDELGRLLKVDYIDDKTISGHLIPFLANYHGFSMPSMLAGSNVGQLLQGEGLSQDDTKSFASLLEVQNIIWRRILSDLVEIRRTKGTINSLKSVLKNIGINPNGAVRIKEYGGSRFRYINDSLERRENTSRMLSFTGSNNEPETFDDDGVYSNLPLLRSPFLTSPRIEPGFPQPSGDLSTGQSDDPNDELLTSGSWTAEGFFKLTSKDAGSKQSLMRMQSVGNDSGDVLNHLIFNLVASPPNQSNDFKGNLTLWANFDDENTISTVIDDINVFDGRQWYVSFGREKHTEDGKLGSTYHLRANRIKLDGNEPLKHSSINFVDESENVQQQKMNLKNEQGLYLVVGKMNVESDFDYYLNGSGIEEANLLDFTGRVTHLRFYTKHLSEKESQTHALNFRSAGVKDPKLNYNFVKNLEGSYERLRLEYTMEQHVVNSDLNGSIEVFDFSQNELHGIGTGFGNEQNVIIPEKFHYNVLNPKLESAADNNKVRIRSFQSGDNVIRYDAEFAPLHEIPGDEQPNDDRRVEIEASLVQALNDDIATIFASLDGFNNYIGAPELVFSREYRDLRNLRRVYFNRLTDRINMKKFFEFFKWFDEAIGDVLDQLIPYNSKYLGTNFIIESHALERPKFTYSYQDMYLGEIDRRPTSVIYLQQFIANLRKF